MRRNRGWRSERPALRARAVAAPAAIATTEVRRRHEAAGERDLQHGEPRLLQQRLAAVETKLAIKVTRRLAERAAAEAFEMARRKASVARETIDVERLLDGAPHLAHDLGEFRMRDREARLEASPLMDPAGRESADA